jgi:hypothetical protein
MILIFSTLKWQRKKIYIDALCFLSHLEKDRSGVGDAYSDQLVALYRCGLGAFDVQHGLQQNGLRLNFPYACPEPVLVT